MSVLFHNNLLQPGLLYIVPRFLQRLQILQKLSGSDYLLQASAAGSQTPQEKLNVWLRQKYEAFCRCLLELLHLDVPSTLQVANRFLMSPTTDSCDAWPQ